jgi:hypothetical protein
MRKSDHSRAPPPIRHDTRSESRKPAGPIAASASASLVAIQMRLARMTSPGRDSAFATTAARAASPPTSASSSGEALRTNRVKLLASLWHSQVKRMSGATRPDTWRWLAPGSSTRPSDRLSSAARCASSTGASVRRSHCMTRQGAASGGQRRRCISPTTCRLRSCSCIRFAGGARLCGSSGLSTYGSSRNSPLPFRGGVGGGASRQDTAWGKSSTPLRLGPAAPSQVSLPLL